MQPKKTNKIIFSVFSQDFGSIESFILAQIQNKKDIINLKLIVVFLDADQVQKT